MTSPIFKRHTALAAAGACLLLSGCAFDGTVQVGSDLLLSGKFEVEINAKQLSEATKQAATCQNFATNLNQQQKANQMQPYGRLQLVTKNQKEDGDNLICDFEFKDWDPNANRQILQNVGDGMLLKTEDPGKLLKGANFDKFSLTLQFPGEVRLAPGGKIDGNQVTFDSVDAFANSHQIITGQPEKYSTWQLLTYGLIALVAVGGGIAVALGLRHGVVPE
ncbi:hypothetical protein BK816_07920 [Boudabousia tangfeifanii]|uniref:DUF3153 domain-containing protein n=1 Tax=Boudabousia tangfeifanii TaxID=1912795 RepID=A0A1D9MLP9_9ACTO|nr:hypothetical protein [Boudabousia tangfeifanii]AOZ73222.1 hypothetical protein BK816_07920 [Boudabousia tangfeifanii]